MSGLRFIFIILSLLRTTTILFIRSASNYDFVRNNHQRRTILKKLFKQCSLLIGSYNVNIRHRTTNTIKNHHQRHVGDVPLPEIHHNEKKASASKDSNPNKNGRSARRRRNRQKNWKLSKMIKKDGTSFKGNNVKCNTCEAFQHITEK
jgi:hypothetical protein